MRALALAVVLAGCAATTYDRPGGTDEAFERDVAACRAQLSLAPAPRDLVAAGNQMSFMDDCLRAQDWRPTR